MKKPTDQIIHKLKCGCICTKRKGWVFCEKAKALYQKTFSGKYVDMKNYHEHFIFD